MMPGEGKAGQRSTLNRPGGSDFRRHPPDIRRPEWLSSRRTTTYKSGPPRGTPRGVLNRTDA